MNPRRRLFPCCSLGAGAAFLLASCLWLRAQSTETSSPPGEAAAGLFPLAAIRLLKGPFTSAVAANRQYLLAHDPNRLLAPFLREAGLKPKAEPYGNWENLGLDGHTAGHYLSALAGMIASGADTPEQEFRRRLDDMIDELARCQQANGDGYIGGIPGSHELWTGVAAGRIEANGFGLNGKWVPWYNIHKTFAGLRDAWQVAGNQKARELLIRLGDWCERVTSGLSDEQMQDMLRAEHGGMDEVLADLYAMTGDEKYLRLARRFLHHAILDPLMQRQDQLTGKHANTQIPKVIGLARIAALTGDREADVGARFFWKTVTGRRSVAFGGNSVAEHFNDPQDFRSMLEHREGPETCNTYNMLRLTEQLFTAEPEAALVDFYERALFNHLLSAINPEHPGYVYFTPIRPGHYRVYSQPEQAFWCCVGSGMENPGRYGRFIYARARDGLYVNLFIASQLTDADAGLTLLQETDFPDEERACLTLKLERPSTFTLHLRHPAWVAGEAFAVRVNGQPIEVGSEPSSYTAIRREWQDGDRVEIELPMRTTAEGLPDGSDWYAILRGPIVLVSPAGTENLDGLLAGPRRGDHVARGPLIPLDRMSVLLTTPGELATHVLPEAGAGPLNFRLKDVGMPASPQGLPLVPFFRLHDSRYQMYWEMTTAEGLAARRKRLAAHERAKLAREAATLDAVAIGEQQPEVEHAFAGEETETGEHEGRRWRHGQSFQYTLDAGAEKNADLVVTYWGGDAGRVFDIFANDTLLATEQLRNAHPGKFFEQRYPIPQKALAAAKGRVTIRFVAKVDRAGGIFDVRLMKPEEPAEAD